MSRKSYLCIQRSPQTRAEAREMPSPAQMEALYARFTAWRERFSDNIVDIGGRLDGPGKIVTADGASDGPFVEAKEVVGGYMVIVADSIEQAVEIAQQSPGVAMPGSSVEVREIRTT